MGNPSSQFDQSNSNPLIDPCDTDNTCMHICAALAYIQHTNYLESISEYCADPLLVTGKNLLLESIDQAVRYMARMPVSELDGPLKEVKNG